MIEECSKSDYDRIIELGKEIKKSYSIKDIGPNDKILIYKEQNQIIGFLEYNQNYETIDLLNIVVTSSKRREGIATKLLNSLLEKDHAHILLEVRVTNDAAIKFYEKNGFKIIRTIKNYYDDEDGYSMERTNMKDTYIMAVESSCDETSISIVKNGRIDVYTCVLTQMDTHAEFGGVVPEIASRMHTENITLVLEDVMKNSNISWDMIDAIAVTYAPGLLGSLLVGVEFAKTISLIHNKPLIAVNHLAGHIYANNLVEPIAFPSLALVVSGGNTELVLMKGDYDFEILGSTLDDAIGECYDKVARIIGLKYPGGPNVERYAKEGKHTYDLPIPMNDESLNFSYSGLKSYIINLVHNETQRGNEINKYDLARSFQDTAIDELVRKTSLAIKKYDIKNMIVAGGVSANSHLREELTKLCEETNIHLSIPPMKYCTDNATMIGAAAYPLYKAKKFANYDLNAKSQENLFESLN